jgi:hypothetical protein
MRLSQHHRSPIGKRRSEWDHTTNSQSSQNPMHILQHRQYSREEYQMLRPCKQLVREQCGPLYSTLVGSLFAFEAERPNDAVPNSTVTIARPSITYAVLHCKALLAEPTLHAVELFPPTIFLCEHQGEFMSEYRNDHAIALESIPISDSDFFVRICAMP